MNAENLLQSKLNKVKSFIDNESFVFTFSKTNAFAIHKDQLFKNQLYKTYIDHNGYEINERKNSPFIKNEKIKQILNKNFLFDSSRISIDNIGENIVYEPKENEVEINSKKFKIKENISKIDSANGKIFYNDDNKIKNINYLNNLTIYSEDKYEPFKPIKLYKSTIPFNTIKFNISLEDDEILLIDGKTVHNQTTGLDYDKHVIACQDVKFLKNAIINDNEPLINHIVEISEKESGFKFDKPLVQKYDDYIRFEESEPCGVSVISIKKKCTSLSFYSQDNNSGSGSLYLYIDGNYYGDYDGPYGGKRYSITGLTDEVHEFTWLFINYGDYRLMGIDSISFDGIKEIDESLFTNEYDNDIVGLKYISDEIKEKIINNTIKVEGGLGFYKISKSNNEEKLYLYIDYDIYSEDNNFRYCIIGDKKYLLNQGINLIETKDTDIYIEIVCKKDVVISVLTDNHIYNKNELVKYNKDRASIVLYSDEYKNGDESSTPFYNDATGSKIVSIKKTCSKMSFYYKTKNNSSNCIYLYIDGKYYNKYSSSNNTWTLITVDNLTNKEHEFTWVLYSNTDGYYSCIDTISFNDVVEIDSNLFSNTYDNELRTEFYKNVSNSSTPFYNDTVGIKIVSIKKTCSKMSFYYKTNVFRNCIYLYIDGNYYNGYGDSNNIWTLITVDNLTNKEHEFTWVLHIDNYLDDYYSCIDTISFNDVIETDSSLFSNKGTIQLPEIADNSEYKNGSKSSTPFYNDTVGFKIVSIKKTCSKMSFYYKTKNNNKYNNYIYLYIDGNYCNRYYNSAWALITVDNLTNKEHEFTWVLYSNTDGYSCIDTISFNDVIETDSSLFSNTYDNELQNEFYKNGSKSSTPFYNNTIGFKIVSIKKTCSKMSFYYKTKNNSNDNYIYLYIDGNYYNRYSSDNTWTLITVDNLSNKEHEFTWVLYSNTDGYYSCIDTISFNDVIETDSSLFSNTYDNELKNENTVNPFYFYNNTIGFKIVSIKKTCSKMSFYYKTIYSSSNYIYLYIDGKYYNKYSSDNTWTLITVDNLSNKEHEFTWVFYNDNDSYYSCIDTISFNDIVETDSSLFTNTFDNELKSENIIVYQSDSKIIDFCTFIERYNENNTVYIYYIDNKYNLHRILYNGSSSYGDCIENIKKILNTQSINWTDYGDGLYAILFLLDKNNRFKILVHDYVDDPYNDRPGFYESIFAALEEEFKDKEIKNIACDKEITDETLNETIYILTESGEVYESFVDLSKIDVITTERIKYNDIRFVDMKKTEYGIILLGEDGKLYVKGKFVNGEFGLYNTPSITIDNNYKNGDESSTPFYNNAIGIKTVSIKKTCSKMSFYYKTKYNNSLSNCIYLYIDGNYYNLYGDSTWTLITVDNLSNEEHEFTWELYNYSDSYSCIDTISFDDVVETDSSLFTIIDKTSKTFESDKLVCISRDEYLEDGEYKLRNIYTLKLYNTDASDGGVCAVKEDGKLYYTGINNGICGKVFGHPTDAQNINVWTPVENNANDIGRISTPRPDYWSYYFDYIMKSDKNSGGNSVENIFFKIDDVWIDWNAYISKYMNVTLRDADNKILKKYKEFKKTDNSTLRKVINFDSFIEYLKLNKESIINEFKVDRTLIPQVDYIDKDLNVYTINAGDNISCIKYSQKDIDLLNVDLIESLNHNIRLKNEYEDVIENSLDPEEIFEYQNRLAVIELNIEDLNKEIANNQNKLGTMNSNNYLDFNDNKIFNPMTVVDTEEKTINYLKSNFSEPNENGEIEIETEEIDGALHVVKSTVSKTVESNITKLKIDLINYDRINNSSISDAEVLRDDIKMTIMDDPNDERNFEVDDLLVWLNGKFVTKDYKIGKDNKAFCNYNGLAEVETRRICEFPGLGEPTQNSNNIPTITGENATVIEPTVPTELRWDLSTKVFSWEGVKIDGPYKIHDLNNVNSELRRVEFFYFGDVYCSVFTQFLIKNKKYSKNTFILFFNGAVVPEDEYDVSIKGNNTYITLKKFTAYVTSLLQDKVDIMKPGYEGRVRHILSQFDNMSQFSIAFLSSTDRFKKVKMYYDYQTIRDVPKPGQVIFNDIKYNDLILFDGRYIPYLWESRHCIRIPETVDTIRSSENNFIHHSTICRARPYSTYKKESELTDTECRMYAKQNGLINDEEISSLDISYIRERVKPHIEARIKEI